MNASELEDYARGFAKQQLEERVKKGEKTSTATYSSNFPPSLYLLNPKGELGVVVGFHEDRRVTVIKEMLKKFPDSQVWVLCYDGLVSEMKQEECTECEGKGCRACLGSGRERKGGKRDAIITIRGERETRKVSATSQFYTTIGGRVLTEGVLVHPGDEAEHGYGRVWE